MVFVRLYLTLPSMGLIFNVSLIMQHKAPFDEYLEGTGGLEKIDESLLSSGWGCIKVSVFSLQTIESCTGLLCKNKVSHLLV